MQSLGFIGGEEAEDKNKSRGKSKLINVGGADASDASSSEAESSAEVPKQKRRGANRKRKIMNTHERSLCVYVVSDRSCPFGDNCRYSHDVRTFASNRPPDIGDSCPIFALSGHCRYGVTCRFGSQHIGAPPDYTNLVDAERTSAFVAKEFEERNSLPSDVLQSLRKRRYNFSLSNTILSSLPKPADTAAADTAPEPASSTVTSTRDVSTAGDSSSSSQQTHTLGAVTDADTIRLRSAEVPKVSIYYLLSICIYCRAELLLPQMMNTVYCSLCCVHLHVYMNV